MLSSNETKPDIEVINPTKKNNTPSRSIKENEKYSRPSTIFNILTAFFISTILILIIATFYADSPTEQEKRELQNLENRMEQGERLTYQEKLVFTDLLWKVKRIRLFTSKTNYIRIIGSLTGYKVTEHDLDWRKTGKTLDDALKEAFLRTGIPMEQFKVTQWAVDANGKTLPVEWKGGDAEVNIDSPHVKDGPDVYHVGFQFGKKQDKVVGHIFLDFLAYYREVK